MPPTAAIAPARTAADYADARRLFEAYAADLGVDLCFQDFTTELDALDRMYGPPRGRLLLARADDAVVGCVAVRPLPALGGGACEMKRLYVSPSARGQGLGRHLAEAVVEAARELGYDRMLLDTLERMAPARTLYASLGFAEVPPYYPNPLDGVRYLALTL